jgi:hypothetical protein
MRHYNPHHPCVAFRSISSYKKRCFHVVVLQNDYYLFVIKEETMATMMPCIVRFLDGHWGYGKR